MCDIIANSSVPRILCIEVPFSLPDGGKQTNKQANKLQNCFKFNPRANSWWVHILKSIQRIYSNYTLYCTPYYIIYACTSVSISKPSGKWGHSELIITDTSIHQYTDWWKQIVSSISCVYSSDMDGVYFMLILNCFEILQTYKRES